MSNLLLAIPVLFGLEGLAAEELRRLALNDVRAENGRVFCAAAPADLPRVNLNLRTGERVLLVLGQFYAHTFDALFEQVRALPWEDFVPQNGAFPVKGYSLNSALHSVPACQSIIKKAAAARLGQKYGLQRLPEDGALYQIQFSILKDQVTVTLDTSGPGLHKRGYRAVGVAAPLRETLAAAMVLLSRYQGRDPFCDPFCGSGTIAIEAALIAKNRAPGLNRSFAAQRWEWLPADLWMAAADEAMDGEFDGQYEIWGGDIDPAAVEIAQNNAVKADVEDLIRFETADAARFCHSEPYGRLVTNPPYGERILEKQQAETLYRSFGQAARRLPEGWRVSVLSSHTEFERAFGRTAVKRRKLYNGMIKCDLFQYGGPRRKQAGPI
ncbi:class I SAM-dependent RNA methyltransferase [Pseudoflavonifractor sp. 524-17]|uniref:THUMP domain-containing class I SAM-dependent RNA methyltransferase n=1 Tax=Pseudoflavonifractor sp. 524-17 TaxID=2304577 RepID=UPI00137B5372|nr:class I SAM-dependent RNA methyltransferase [Pseudoflavonifractor sp. 524-17]NCE64785.1 class I SAM-dependent RNA methyltransferase [Pseudoflavonifractor sp. 524-17]